MKYSAKQLATALIDEMEKKGADVKQVTREFVHLLAERNELKRMGDVVRAIDLIWKKRHGAATITVETAHPMNDALRKQLEKIAPGAEVREVINEALIGGARVRIDDRMIDSTISGHLERLKTHLKIC